MSQKRADTSGKDKDKFSDVKFEHRLNIKDLEALEAAFSYPGDGYDNKLSLTKEQFSEALTLVLNKGLKEEYDELFDQVDIARDGVVDWDKIASHMLLTFYEKDDKVKSNLLPNWKDLRALPGPHKDVIVRVTFLKNIGRYLTISREGNVGLWGPDMRLQRSVKASTESCKSRDLWITDFATLPNVNKVAVAFTSKELAFYDMSAKLEFTCQYRVQDLYMTPLCMSYWFNPDNPNEATLAWGDTAGYVNIIMWTSATIALFERPHQAGGQEKEETTLNVKLTDIEDRGKSEADRLFKNVRFIRYSAHTDWVRQVRYLSNLDCYLSCATTWNDAMCIGWMEKRIVQTASSYTPIRNTYFQIHQGINAFDYHAELNLIATAGVGHHVCLWNPYVVSKPNGLLRGHMAAVVQVQFNHDKNQLISFSKDKVLRIWDIQLQVCLQRLAGVFPKDQEGQPMSMDNKAVTTTLYFHEERGRLFLTFNHALTVLEMKPEIKERIMSHDKPIVGLLYLPEVNQVVTACQGGIVAFWMLENGQKVKSIYETHGEAEVTCIANDSVNNHILTGSTDGTVKIWDHNGHLFHTLVCMNGNPADVGQITFLKRSIIVVGMSPDIVPFKTSSLKSSVVNPSEWKGGREHGDDILTATFIPPHTLVTGSYDGEIVIWNTNSEQASRRLTQRCRKRTGFPYAHGARRDTGRRSVLSHRSEQTSRHSLAGATSCTPLTPSSLELGGPESSGISCSTAPAVGTQVDKEAAKEDEFEFVVTRIIFLSTRSGAKGDGNLVTCGGNGFVRFWNILNCTLVAEFPAHEHAGNIIMGVSVNEEFLATGDVDGVLKIWNITGYAMAQTQPPHEVLTTPPTPVCQWSAHSDMISEIFFIERQNRQLVITASSDCSVTIWDIYGHHIGTFGQPSHWKIEAQQELVLPAVTLEQKDESAAPSEYVEEKKPKKTVTMEEVIPSTQIPESFHINTWEKTVLGRDYQEIRVKKRQRKQPGRIDKLPFLFSEKTGQPPFGPFYSLKVTNYDEVEDLEKPDFYDNPERYFADKEDESDTTTGFKLPMLSENTGFHNVNNLKAAFDERTLFPRYVLEFDQQMRKLGHLAMGRRDRSDSQSNPTTIPKLRGSNPLTGVQSSQSTSNTAMNANHFPNKPFSKTTPKSTAKL